ncbi:MAG: M23 family metallopeptidase [Bacilli bacterium]|nr:M23 family metallopeptidase [Bacilli bacterium]
MKKVKFKGWVLPSLYAFLFVGAFLVTLGVSNLFMEKTEEPEVEQQPENYVTETIVEEQQPVVKQETKILKPFNSDKVEVGKYYYDYKGSEDNQEKSLTYHDNTYMQNSGVDYKADEVFEVVSVLDGTVSDVKKDELLGNCVEIKHNNNYTTVYQSLSEVNVNKGDNVVAGQLIGKSGSNTLDQEEGNHLHFEMYINGQVVNPLDYVDKEINTTPTMSSEENNNNQVED